MYKKLSDEETAEDANVEDDKNELNAPPLNAFSNNPSNLPPSAPAAASLRLDVTRQPSDSMIPKRRMERAMPGDAESKKLVVGRDIQLKGQITSCERLVVEGCVEAALTDAKIIEISSSGFFKGSAQVMEADVSGRFEGELTVTDKLTVRNGGKINGVIRYGRIIIESGGEIAGEMESLADSYSEETMESNNPRPSGRPAKKKK